MSDIKNSQKKYGHISKKTIVLIIIVVTATIAINTLVSMLLFRISKLSIPSIGNIKTIGYEAYWERNCSNKVVNIDWDPIWIGPSENVTFSGVTRPVSQNVTLYLHSIGNIETSLNIISLNWDPVNISRYIMLRSDNNGTIISANETTQISLTLLISPSYDFFSFLIENDIKTFSLDIVISSQEYSH